MPLILLTLFIIIPVVEIYLFIEIGGLIGTGWTIILIFLTALFGMRAMRSQGLAVLAQAQAAQATGRAPVGAAAHGVLILLGGVLLLLPGFMSDTLGILCLIPFIRRLILEAAINVLVPLIGATIGRTNRTNHTGSAGRTGRAEAARGQSQQTQNKRTAADDGTARIIEGEYRVTDAKENDKKNNH